MPTTTPTTTPTLTELLTHLVRMPTISSDHATNRAALDWVELQLEGLPLHIRRLEHQGSPSLIATTQPTRNPKLWLAAHMDVVPAPAEAFEPTIKAGKFYARGAYDMKPAIAMYIKLLKELGHKLPSYDLGLMITSDEEVSGTDGVGWLMSQGYRGQAVILPDSLKDWEIEIGMKGASFWRFTSQGQPAHGSRVWSGDNAIERLMNFIDVLRANTRTEPCGDPHHIHHTLNIGQLHGGMVVNQVPDSAEALVDMRITPEVTLEHVAEWVKAAQAVVPQVQAEMLPMQAHPTMLTTDGPVALFERLAEAAIGRPLPHVLAHGGTDARWFAAHKIPVITVSPTGGDPHGLHEWIDLDSLTQYYKVVSQFVDQVAKP